LLHLAKCRRSDSLIHHRHIWWHKGSHSSVMASHSCISASRSQLLLSAQQQLSAPSIASSTVLKHLVFTSMTSYSGNTTYTHTRHIYHSMPETVEHRILRSRKAASVRKGVSEPEAGTEIEDQRSAGKSITVSPLHRMANKPSPTSTKVQLVVSSSDYIALNKRWLINNEGWRIWKEAAALHNLRYNPGICLAQLSTIK
jgi:hypothetical protein